MFNRMHPVRARFFWTCSGQNTLTKPSVLFIFSTLKIFQLHNQSSDFFPHFTKEIGAILRGIQFFDGPEYAPPKKRALSLYNDQIETSTSLLGHLIIFMTGKRKFDISDCSEGGELTHKSTRGRVGQFERVASNSYFN